MGEEGNSSRPTSHRTGPASPAWAWTSPPILPQRTPSIGDLGQASQKGEVGTKGGKWKRCELLRPPPGSPEAVLWEGAGGQVPFSQEPPAGIGMGDL